MTVESAKAKLDAQEGDPATGYISKADHQDSYDELVDDTALTGATTAEALDVTGALTAGTVNGRDPDDLVAGPASATDNALVRFDGTGGKTVQNSGLIVDDSNNLSGVGTIGSGAVTSSGAVQAAAASGFVVGASGPRMMSGTGSPEGVVTAPVGSIWFQTDSTVGVSHWRKASGTGNTGWVVMAGDTGWRDMSASLMNSWALGSGGYVRLRRVGTQVVCTFRNADKAAASGDGFLTLPAGFTAFATSHGVGSAIDASNVAFVPVYMSGTSIVVVRRSAITGASGLAGGQTIFETGDAWPSSLPGTAA